MAKRKWRWVSRDRYTPCCVNVWLTTVKPKDIFSVWRSPESSYAVVCATEFLRVFGVCPHPGECVKVEFGPAKILKTKGVKP